MCLYNYECIRVFVTVCLYVSVYLCGCKGTYECVCLHWSTFSMCVCMSVRLFVSVCAGVRGGLKDSPGYILAMGLASENTLHWLPSISRVLAVLV